MKRYYYELMDEDYNSMRTSNILDIITIELD